MPYLMHVVDVCQEALRACLEDGALETDLVMHCALLHDTLEDTAVTAGQLGAEFGAAVLAGVQSLSKNADLPKADAMRDSLARIRREPREIATVKLADRIVNMQQPPNHWDSAKRRAYQEEARVIREELAGLCPYLEQRLEQKIELYSAYLGG